jgi:hypothetical protein
MRKISPDEIRELRETHGISMQEAKRLAEKMAAAEQMRDIARALADGRCIDAAIMQNEVISFLLKRLKV